MNNFLTNSGFIDWSNDLLPEFKFCCFCGRRWQTFFIIMEKDITVKYYVNQEQRLPHTSKKCPLCSGTLVDYKPYRDENIELVIE